MAEGAPPDVLVVTGPTASGKTDVAIRVAQAVGGEIISMDSRQVYRGMDIGTAKPAPHERGGVPHHGFDLVDPSERFNAGRFAVLARDWIDAIRKRGRVPVLAGGTGFFLKALTEPLFEEPALDPVAKERWKRYLQDVPTAEMARWVAALDPAARVRPQDRQRLARVIELTVLTGRPLSWWHTHAPAAAPAADSRVFVLDLPRDLLYRRIEERVESMVSAGLMAEVEALLAAGYNPRDPGLNATGYIEAIPYLQGEYDLAEAVSRIQAATRRYARRQMTWLRHQLPSGACWLDARRSVEELATEIVDVWRKGSA
jgi:tRNA dimethylallyltransferase